MPRMKPARPPAFLPGNEKKRSLVRIAKLLESEEWDEAEIQLQHFLAVYPEDRTAHEMLADLAFSTEDVVLSEAETTWLVTHYPNEPQYYLHWIASAGLGVYLALTILRMQQALEKWPNHPKIQTLRAQLLDIEHIAYEDLNEKGLFGAER